MALNSNKINQNCFACILVDLFYFVACLADNIVWTVFGLGKDLCDILPNDTHGKELDTTDENNHTTGRSPALYRITKDKSSYYNKKNRKERQTGKEQAAPGSNA